MIASLAAGQVRILPGIALGILGAALNDFLLSVGVELSMRPRLGWKGTFLLLGTGTAVRLGLAALLVWVAYELSGVYGVVGFALGVSAQLVAYIVAAIKVGRT